MDDKIKQLEKELKENRKLSKEEINKINKKIFENIIMEI